MSDEKQPQFTPEQIAAFEAYDNYLADKAHKESSTSMYPIYGGGAGAAVGSAVGAGQAVTKIPDALKEALSVIKSPASKGAVEGAPGMSAGDKWGSKIGGPGGETQDAAVKNRAMQKSLTPEEAAKFKVGREGIIVPNKEAARIATEEVIAAKKPMARLMQGVKALGPMGPILGKGLAVGSAGYDIGDVIDRSNKGQYGRAIVSGLGALGSGASLAPHPIVKGLGIATGMGAPALNMYLDKLAEEHPELAEKLHLAIGGLVHLR